MSNKGDLTGLETIWRCWQICEILEIFTKHSPNFPKRFLLSPNLLYSPCYHNTVAMMFIVLSLHLQLISTTMLFKQAYGFLLSIHLQVLVTTVRCLSKLTRQFCHSSVSIRLTFRMVYLHVGLPILYATVMSLIFLSTPWHPDVLCYHSTASVSLPFEFLVIIVLCPTISQLKVVATFIIIMEKKKTVSLKNIFIYWLLRHYNMPTPLNWAAPTIIVWSGWWLFQHSEKT